MDIFLLVIRLILAGIFALAGIGKLLDRDGSRKAIIDFGLPASIAGFLSALLTFAELALAVAFLFVESSWYGAAGSLALLIVFLAGMSYQVFKGRSPDCHCFGAVHSEPVGITGIVRNIVFAVLALLLVLSGRNSQGIDAAGATREGSFMTFILGITIVGLLIAAVVHLRMIGLQQTQIMRRIDALEISGLGPAEQTDKRVTAPVDGLPIGAPVEDFSGQDLKENVVSLTSLLAPSKPILFFYVGVDCVPCAALLPEMKTWYRQLAEKVNVVLISEGPAKQNREKFSGDFPTVILQKSREITSAMGIKWTPTAILVNPAGRIASHAAAGDTAVRELVNMIIQENAVDPGFHVVNGTGPGQAPKIGQPLPEFSLADLEGRKLAAKHLRGHKTLVTFWSPSCTHCEKMLEDLRTWDKAKGKDEPELLVFSDGDPDRHKALQLKSPIVLDEGYKVAETMGMFGTPSAILVDEDGKIVSETAIGAEQIWALVGRRTTG
jgi:peroxiredoxin/uncharacterized membrane protein YphA (DoxX/SURF4 family)